MAPLVPEIRQVASNDSADDGVAAAKEALPLERYREQTGGKLFFRGDTRKPQKIFRTGLIKRDRTYAQPKRCSNQGNVTPASAVCLSHDYATAALYPAKTDVLDSFIYVLDLNPHQAVQLAEDRDRNKGESGEAADDWMVNFVVPSRIVGCYRIQRRFRSKRYDQGGTFQAVGSFTPNPNYDGRIIQQQQYKNIVGSVALGKWQKLAL